MRNSDPGNCNMAPLAQGFSSDRSTGNPQTHVQADGTLGTSVTPRISVIVPTYCEAENLPLLVPRIAAALREMAASYEIVIVDDASPDETGAVCRALAERYPLRLVVRRSERGLAGAVLDGMRTSQADLLVVMDADLSHPPEKIPELIHFVEDGGDFVIGSRYVRGASIQESWGAFRWLNSKVAAALVRPLVSPRDPLSGFFAMRRERFRDADVPGRLNPLGYKIGLELMIKCSCTDVREVPIVFLDRACGESKLTMKEQVNYLRHVVRLYRFWLAMRLPTLPKDRVAHKPRAEVRVEGVGERDVTAAEPDAGRRAAPGGSGVVDTWGVALLYYFLTSLVVVLAAVFAVDFVPLCRDHYGSARRADVLSSFAAWDGLWYGRIASIGYSYDPQQTSSVAFFPLYPALAAPLIHGLGMRPEVALLVVSHAALIGVFALLATYVRRRFSSEGDDFSACSLLALGLFPTTFYFRMTYTESIFMLVMLLAMYGMLRDWRPFWIAATIGLATAARSVGVALVPVFWLYMWQRMADAPGGAAGRRGRFGLLVPWSLRTAAWMPLCCWGLIAYIVFQWYAFGEPLAFVQTQVHWAERSLGFWDRVTGTLTLEPIRAVYDPTSNCYWARVAPEGNLLFNMKAANPVYFLATIALVGWGAFKRWLDAREVLLAAGLLLIPYCLQGARTGMSSQARYAAVVFPVYIVLGHVLHRLPPGASAGLLAISGLLMAIYTAMFVNWYWFY